MQNEIGCGGVGDAGGPTAKNYDRSRDAMLAGYRLRPLSPSLSS